MFLQIDLDADGFAEGLKLFEDELDRLMPEVLDGSLQAIVATARELAPQGETSELRNSILALPITGQFSSEGLVGVVEAGAPHALPVEEGSVAHDIRPRYRLALRWPVEGGFRFARFVRHPGTAAQPFLEPALRQEESAFIAEASAAVELAFSRSGL